MVELDSPATAAFITLPVQELAGQMFSGTTLTVTSLGSGTPMIDFDFANNQTTFESPTYTLPCGTYTIETNALEATAASVCGMRQLLCPRWYMIQESDRAAVRACLLVLAVCEQGCTALSPVIIRASLCHTVPDASIPTVPLLFLPRPARC